ncbi:hypothetical protein ASG65_01410 [Bacillus sp. Leaf13]|nr:hypothetical protein ASG65_01410 [Bacillus sp. Leaf13]
MAFKSKRKSYLWGLFAKKVISEILCGDVLSSSNHNLKITVILVNDFCDAEIYREWRNIDFVVFSKKNDLVIMIENKVYAGLSKNQLEKYLYIIKEAYPSVKHIISVFLTIEGEEGTL